MLEIFFIMVFLSIFSITSVPIFLFFRKRIKNKEKRNRNKIKEPIQPNKRKVYLTYEEEKGRIGESKVREKLNSISKVMENKDLHNFTFYDEKGNSHQIDHITIRKNGIFCIETKNYSGILMGDYYQEFWTQCLNDYSRIKIKNPLNQNYGHICELNKILNNKYPVYSLIVLVKDNADTIPASNVINLSDLETYLNNYKSEKTLTSEEIDRVFEILLHAKKYISNENHIKNLKNRGIITNDSV